MPDFVIYTKDYCPYCDLAKTLIQDLGYGYREIDVSDDPKVLMTLIEQTHLRTVPQIFFGDTFIGGYTDLRSQIDRGNITAKSDK